MVIRHDNSPLVILAVIILVAICALGMLINDKFTNPPQSQPAAQGGNPLPTVALMTPLPPAAAPNASSVQATQMQAQAIASATALANDARSTQVAHDNNEILVQQQRLELRWRETLQTLVLVLGIALSLAVLALIAAATYRVVVDANTKQIEAEARKAETARKLAGSRPVYPQPGYNGNHQPSNRQPGNIPPRGDGGKGGGSYNHPLPRAG